MHGLMRILTVLCLLLVASACGGSQPSATPPEPAPPPVVEPAPAAEPVPEPPPAPTATEAEQAPPDTKLAVQGEGSHSIFAVLKVKDPKAFAESFTGLHAELEKADAIAYLLSQGQDQKDLVIAHIIGRSGEKLGTFLELQKAKPDGLFAGASEFFVTLDDAYEVPSPWPEQTTYSVFLRFKVKDYDKWRASFDKNGEVRAASGVIGYGIHHSINDDRVIVHYLAKSTDLVRQLVTMPEITKLMKDQGIQGKPKPLYTTNIRAQSLPAK